MKAIRIITAFFIALMFFMVEPPIAANAAAKLPKKLMIESPKQKSSYLNKDIVISGWAQDPSGVKQINVYLNGKLHGRANLGIKRADVNKISPGYPQGNNSGYSYSINYSTLTSGSYKITVELVGKDSKKVKKDVNITFKKTVQPIKAAIDKPIDKVSTNANSIVFAGWTTGPSGIKEIKVYLDGSYKGSTVPKITRKDVQKLFPGYKNSLTSGFSYELSMLNVTKGIHKVAFEYIGNDGQVLKAERTFDYKGLAPKYGIENPKADFTTDLYNLKVNGWAVNSAGIREINIYIDNIFSGKAVTQGKRPDIAQALPGYPQGEDSGFNYDIDIRNLSSGKHSLKVEIVAEDGTIISEVRSFTYNKPVPIISIDSPRASENINTSTVTVSGWAVDVSGVKEITVKLDGNYVGTAAYGGERTDLTHLAEKFPEYTLVGFSHSLDISTLSTGQHTLEVVVEGMNGVISSSKTSLNMYGIVEYVDMDNNLDYYVQRQFDKGGNVIFGSSTVPTYEQLKYYMDPNNFINDPSGKYMFLKLTYIEGIDVNDLNKTLVGKGVLEGKGQAYLDAGKLHNINPIYLVAHSLLETGNGTSKLSNGISVSSVAGKPVETKDTYNVYGIGAKDSNPIVLGSEYAYNQQWFSVEAAIIGGAKFISGNYIQSELYKQYTLYKMKWNFEVLWHQYATDIGWASKQTKFIKALVDQMEKPVLVFEVPVFKN